MTSNQHLLRRSFLVTTLVATLVTALLASLAGPAVGQARLVKDLYSGSLGAYPDNLFTWRGHVYFTALTPTHGRELFRTDGTTNGTELVADVVAGVAGSDPEILGAAGDWLVFSAKTSAMGRELYATKGLSFTPLHEINAGANGCDPVLLTTFEDQIYFRANYSGSGLSAKKTLFRCDGTNITTFDETYPAKWNQIVSVQCFRNRILIENKGDLYVSDGTVQNMERIYSGQVPTPLYATVVADHIYFSGFDNTGTQLWRSDGTWFGTKRYMTIDPTGYSSPREIVDGGNGVFFVAFTGATGYEVFWTDGSKLFTFDIYPGKQSSNPTGLTRRYGGKVVFQATEPLAGTELWIADTTNKAYHVDIANGTASSTPEILGAVGSRYIYFSASDQPNDRELWRTDATVAGTKRAADICVPLCESKPGVPVQLGSTLILPATTTVAGRELMAIDLDGTTQTVGQSWGPSSPTLRVTDPVLKDNVTVDVTGPATAHTLMLFLGAPAKPPFAKIGGVAAYFDPNSFLIALGFAAKSANFQTQIGPIPNDPKLVGFQLLMQAAVLGLAQLEATNGVLLYFGK